MKAASLFISMLFSLLIFPCLAQKPLQIDADGLIKGITRLPPTVEELHSLFTVYTKYGEEFRLAENTDPAMLRFKQLVCTIHDSTIRAIMKRSPRKDMVDSIQYEDERWKLALRPLLGNDIKARLTKLNTAIKPTLMQIFEMQSIFDWVNYYREEEKIKKSFREKIAAVSIESSTKTAKAKIQLEISQYKTQQQLWISRYDKYSKALLSLQQLMEKINYGTDVNAEDKQFVAYVLSDVQARALEAHEKLIWNEISVAISGELTFNGIRIINMYTE